MVAIPLITKMVGSGCNRVSPCTHAAGRRAAIHGTSASIRLNDLVYGRWDLVCRCIVAALITSGATRKDALFAVLEQAGTRSGAEASGEPAALRWPPRCGINGHRGRRRRRSGEPAPDERHVASLLQWLLTLRAPPRRRCSSTVALARTEDGAVCALVAESRRCLGGMSVFQDEERGATRGAGGRPHPHPCPGCARPWRSVRVGCGSGRALLPPRRWCCCWTRAASLWRACAPGASWQTGRGATGSWSCSVAAGPARMRCGCRRGGMRRPDGGVDRAAAPTCGACRWAG